MDARLGPAAMRLTQEMQMWSTFYCLNISAVFHIYVGQILRMGEEVSVAGEPRCVKHRR